MFLSESWMFWMCFPNTKTLDPMKHNASTWQIHVIFVLANTLNVFKGFRLPFKTCKRKSENPPWQQRLRSVFCFPWPRMELTSIVFSGLSGRHERVYEKKNGARSWNPECPRIPEGSSFFSHVWLFFGIRYYVTICVMNDINIWIDNIDSISMIYEFYMHVTRIVSRIHPGIHTYTTQNYGS